MKVFFIIFLVMLNLAAEKKLELVLEYGDPISDRSEAIKKRVINILWCGPTHIAYLSDEGTVSCYSVKDTKVVWSKKFERSTCIELSYSAESSHLAITEPLSSNRKVHIVDVKSGKSEHTLNPTTMWEKTVGEGMTNYGYFTGAEYLPNNQGLLLKYRDEVGNIKTLKVSHDYSTDSKYELNLAGEGEIQGKFFVQYDGTFARVKKLSDNKQLLSIGTPPKKNRRVIGPAFYSHGYTDGKNVVLSLDGGCFGGGSIQVFTLPTKTPLTFDTEDRHMEISVNFEKSWIAVTGTSKDLSLFDFKGNKITLIKNASLQRILCIDLSPNGKLLAIGSWDTTIKVFEVKDL
ncbi:MAG: WD40 repeat domain-containing protein [Lentisphaeraceae bacterium]|nr:WD40 repeat domain-containing protein [Lentisphaeraceae bacterium]